MTTYNFDNFTSLTASEEQNKFISSDNKFIILNSCAGSGKTRCLLLKIKYLIETYNIKNTDLIICTYTKAMAKTIKTRINLYFDDLNGALIGTFHSISYQLIKPLLYNNTDISNNEISSQRETGAKQSVSSYESEQILQTQEEILVYTYENIINGNINLSNKYFLIDEYQDLTQMQQKIIYYLLEYNKIKGVFLIGDNNQSIYEFYNGQHINIWVDKILNLNIGSYVNKIETNEMKLKKLGIIIENNETNEEKINKNEQIINKFITLNLTKNYRSTTEIINLANCFLKEEDKMISNYTYNKSKPKLFLFDTWIDEINFLCQIIDLYVKNNRFKTQGSIAVLSRYNKTLELIEDKLLNMNISCNYIKYNSKIQLYSINLSTIHSAKGLEFDNVYFVNSAYNIDKENKQLYDEECRIFYVAITRAKKKLVISSNKEKNQLLVDKTNSKLYDIVDKREFIKTNANNNEDKLIENINLLTIKDKTKSWFAVTDFIKLLGGEHIINIKKILSHVLSFKPSVNKIHNELKIHIPPCFSSVKIISNTQNVFGSFIDALISRHIQYIKKEKIQFQDLNKLVLLNYLDNKTDMTLLTEKQITQLKELYNMSDLLFKSNILLDKVNYDIPKINNKFEHSLRESYLNFIDINNNSIDILYDIFVVSLTNTILNERLAYQYLPQYITKADINDIKYLGWYKIILEHIENLVKDNISIECQKELSNHYLKIIGFADIIIPDKNIIIDVKTSIFEYPKLEHLLQILLYGLLCQTNINRYQIYNPIFGLKYEWILQDDVYNKKYVDQSKNKLIDYISSIIPEINKKRTYRF